MNLYYIAGGILLLILAVSVWLPKKFDTQGKTLRALIDGLFLEYNKAVKEKDLEKKKLIFNKLIISTDRDLAHLLNYFGCNETSVNKQIWQAMRKKVLTYEEYKKVKQFHHMRNRVVHEGLEVMNTHENLVYNALCTMRSVLRG